MFENLKLTIEEDIVKQMFHDIDVDNNEYIEYSELLNYIRSAKIEQSKVLKMKQITEKIDELTRE